MEKLDVLDYVLLIINFLLGSFLILVLLVCLTACGTSTPSPQPSTPIDQTTLRQLRDDIQAKSPTCQYTSTFRGVSKGNCLSEGTGTGDGDVMLFAGLLCLSGSYIGCDTVAYSIDDNGKPWRSPGRVGIDKRSESFSRDMFLGLMAYLVRTKDTATALKFQGFLERNDNRLCLDSCDMTGTTWGLMGEVWQYIELPLTLRMKTGMVTDDFAQWVASGVNEHGYTQHLIAATIYIRQKMNRNSTGLVDAAITLVEKNPGNTFYALLAGFEFAHMTCEVPATSTRMDWLWEKYPEHHANAVGWDCVLVYNMLIKE